MGGKKKIGKLLRKENKNRTSRTHKDTNKAVNGGYSSCCDGGIHGQERTSSCYSLKVVFFHSVWVHSCVLPKKQSISARAVLRAPEPNVLNILEDGAERAKRTPTISPTPFRCTMKPVKADLQRTLYRRTASTYHMFSDVLLW